jgi:ubiquinone/menaquinone biosynthesis C-methylase UbiE
MELFDRIARPYAWFFTYQKKQFNKNLPILLNNLKEADSFLDIGCGTGAMCQALLEQGKSVEGCDKSLPMIGHAKRLTSASIIYANADVTKGLPYGDKSFDVVVASFVAHGLMHDQRLELYKEMRRIARKTVVLYEYGPKRNMLTDIMEYLEKGDYFSFIKEVDKELSSFFGNLTKLPVNELSMWYKMEIENRI